MSLEKIWARENAKRLATKRKKERCNRNWPIHSEMVFQTFRRFSEEATKTGTDIKVQPADPDAKLKVLGTSYYGQSSVVMTFGIEYTGSGSIKRNRDGSEELEHYLEQGASLVIHHSPAEGVIQVFFGPPSTGQAMAKKKDILINYTYNPDYLTPERVEKLISKFLIFNRVESCFEHPGLLDSLWVRWWRFSDVRNRRGFGEKLEHILTPWELVILGVLIATAFPFLKELIVLLNPFNLL